MSARACVTKLNRKQINNQSSLVPFSVPRWAMDGNRYELFAVWHCADSDEFRTTAAAAATAAATTTPAAAGAAAAPSTNESAAATASTAPR